jgi:hypothetical protein
LKTNELLNRIGSKSLTKEALCNKVKQDFSLIPIIIKGVSSPKPNVRYSCGNVLMDLSEKNPIILYPYMDEFIKLLDSKFRILTWNAIFIIANLAQVDDEQKFDAIFEKYFSLLNNDYMVTVANVVTNSGKIALAKPYLMGKISEQLLKVEDIVITPHLTEECKRVIFEKTIQSFNLFFGELDNESRVKVYAIVRKQLSSSRDTLRKEAERFANKWKYNNS